MPTAVISGTPVQFVDAGEGSPALVLLHAFPLHSGMWDDQVAALSPHRRVVAPDLPGFGSTPPSRADGAATMSGFADLVAGLVDHLGIAPAVVGGLSMGGYVTFALLRDHPEMVAGVVLADTRAAADSPEVAGRRTAQVAEVAAGRKDEVLQAMVGTLLSEETQGRRPQVVDRARALMSGASTEGIIAALEAMRGRPDAVAQLSTVDVPALVVVGEHDGPSPPAVAEAMAGALPDAQLKVIDGAGHLSNLENPAAFNDALASFMNRF
ncbi:MAG TPA: alpha/beta fold hydrolase [Acidimicrobiales bacterium]|nr:alpha/beta fold hydrolase [Acidimicrobiales bacterium]